MLFWKHKFNLNVLFTKHHSETICYVQLDIRLAQSQGFRLASSLEWLRGPTKSRASGETGKLCTESHPGVSIPLKPRLLALIGQKWQQTKLLITQPSCEPFHICRMWNGSHPTDVKGFTSVGWKDGFQSDQCLCDFGGTGSEFPCKV